MQAVPGAPAAPGQPPAADNNQVPAGATPAAVTPNGQTGDFIWPEEDVSWSSSKKSSPGLGQFLLMILAASAVLFVLVVVYNLWSRRRGRQGSDPALAG